MEEMNRASLATGQTASNLLYLALNYYRATTDNGHGEVHGKRLNRIWTKEAENRYKKVNGTQVQDIPKISKNVF